MTSYTKQPDGSWSIDPPRECAECQSILPDYYTDVLCMDCLMRHSNEPAKRNLLKRTFDDEYEVTFRRRGIRYSDSRDQYFELSAKCKRCNLPALVDINDEGELEFEHDCGAENA